jgi:hypothetical protein
MAIVNPRRGRDRRRLASVLPGVTMAAVLCIGGCSDQKAQFTGIWKSNCDDYWGLQIKPADRDLYTVTFCGLSGCLEQGEWTPNTPIEGDPMYQLVSSGKIRIKRNDGSVFTYIKCTGDPYWQARSGS